MSTLEKLQDILINEYTLARELLPPDAPLSSLGIDSLGLIELMFQIEDRFGITLPDDNSTNFVTVNDVVRYIDKLLVPQPAAQAAESAQVHGVT
jgi:acyl carrier protein